LGWLLIVAKRQQWQPFMPVLLVALTLLVGILTTVGFALQATLQQKAVAPARQGSATQQPAALSLTQAIPVPVAPLGYVDVIHLHAEAQQAQGETVLVALAEAKANAEAEAKHKALLALTQPGHLANPVLGGQVSSNFGHRHGRLHAGVDIIAPMGTPIRAAQTGSVVFSGWQQGYGQLVQVAHAGGIVETRYAHCSRVLVSTGQRISQGQVIAKVGNTGQSSGPHLHFEVRKHGLAQNPMAWMDASTRLAYGFQHKDNSRT
jgi:murein DD-endopeptidase MepM/ murein hydrolase activator NlpD